MPKVALARSDLRYGGRVHDVYAEDGAVASVRMDGAKRSSARERCALDLCHKIRTHTLYGDATP